MAFIVPGEKTIYRGTTFRSKTEARWAVYFDMLEIPWQYEPIKVALSDGRKYIPDFLLDGCVWAEVKFRGGKSDKAELFAKDSGSVVILLADSFPGAHAPYLQYGAKERLHFANKRTGLEDRYAGSPSAFGIARSWNFKGGMPMPSMHMPGICLACRRFPEEGHTENCMLKGTR